MNQIEDEDQEFHIQLSVCSLVEIWRSYAVSKCHLPAIEPRHPQPLYKIQGLGDWLHDAGLKNDELNLLYLANKYANVALKTSTKNLRQDSHQERYSLGKSFVYNLGG